MDRVVRVVGSHELVAEDRPGFGWEVRIAGSIWSCGLTEKDARACLTLLAKAHIRSKTPRRAPRAECPLCHRAVAIVRGVFGWHNEQEPAPGREGRMCRGYGAVPQ